MGILKPVYLLAAGAGGPVATGLVAAGFAAIGFAAGAWSAKRRQACGLVQFIDHGDKTTDAGDGGDHRRFAGDADVAAEEQPELLLEYLYADSPQVPSRHRKMLRTALPPRSAEEDGADAKPAAFDVDRADSLLQLALDAYSHPPAGQGYQTQDVEGLPIVTFFDKEVMKAIYSGVMVVQLQGALNLRPASGKGTVSPYAEVYVTSGSFRTRAVRNTGNPSWNEKQALFIRNPNWDALTVDVYDNNRAKDKLGTAVLGLAEMIGSNGREFRFHLPLRGPAGEVASVNLSCRYLEFSEFDPDDILEIKPPAPAPSKGQQVTSAGSSSSSTRDKVAGMKPAAFVDNKSSDTQVWLYSDAESRQIVFSFRGTETTQWKDMLTDASLVTCGFKPIKADPNKPPKEKENVSVHGGFMGAYESVRRKLSSLLHAITTSAGADDPWDVLVTGHSLGGALATLAAYELASYKRHAGHIRSVTLYTYGCPRVGNATFASDFGKVLQDAWRLTNRKDLVPSVPPCGMMFKFTHVGNPVRLREDGIFYKGVANLKDDIEKDINWLASLFSWKGVKEHAGEYYLEMLHHGKKLLLQQQQQQQDKSGASGASTGGAAIHVISGSAASKQAPAAAAATIATATASAAKK